MTSHDTVDHDSRSDWILMNAVHDAFRRDLDELLHATAGRLAFRDRWFLFRNQLMFHHTAEDKAMWPLVSARLSGNPDGLALLEAMEDEHRLIDPLLAAIDDALVMDAPHGQIRDMLTRLRTTLVSHLAHEEADALPLISSVMSKADLAEITKAISKMGGIRHAAVMFPWALSTAAAATRDQVLRQLPLPVRLLYRLIWLPRYVNRTPRLDPVHAGAA